MLFRMRVRQWRPCGGGSISGIMLAVASIDLLNRRLCANPKAAISSPATDEPSLWRSTPEQRRYERRD